MEKHFIFFACSWLLDISLPIQYDFLEKPKQNEIKKTFSCVYHNLNIHMLMAKNSFPRLFDLSTQSTPLGTREPSTLVSSFFGQLHV